MTVKSNMLHTIVCRFFLFLVLIFMASEVYAIEIVSPSAGTTVRPGETVTVRIDPSIGEVLQSAYVSVEPIWGEAAITIGDKMVDVDLTTGTSQLVIPCEAVGQIVLTVFGVLDDGVTMKDTILNVEPDSSIDQIKGIQVPAQQPVFLKVGQLLEIRYVGRFSLKSQSPCSSQGTVSDILRDVTLGKTGSTFTSDNPQIVGVSADGVLQGRGPGRSSINVKNRGILQRVAVKVVEDSQAPGNYVPVSRICPVPPVFGDTVVVLDGSQSSDPDNDPLTYLWTQEDDLIIIISDPTEPKLLFIAPPVSEVEILKFSLTVQDSHGAISFPEMVKVKVSPAGSQPIPRFEVSIPGGVQTGARVSGTITMSPASSSPVSIMILVDEPLIGLVASRGGITPGSESLEVIIPAGDTQMMFDLIGIASGNVKVFAYSTGFMAGVATVLISN